jgi:hypothetical protein
MRCKVRFREFISNILREKSIAWGSVLRDKHLYAHCVGAASCGGKRGESRRLQRFAVKLNRNTASTLALAQEVLSEEKHA